MSLIAWIENSALGEWVRVSIWGYPMMITLHSLGLAIMVGLSVVLSLRVLGLFRTCRCIDCSGSPGWVSS